ncbi:T9SS type A sorting domain-containing protein [Psychroflexus aestuariivivens]|uniref:T9SS type A sorting domain-containing protein n=1 Tax=Psychroflexus aestuariivivens TaxID=1795040 RepID=UPI000FDA3698|nr:T9SS type A sorting domain-containing protein [Psychroflexus aestuariivivens]
MACGPNNSADPNIEYRLFYALSSANVSDPLTATEYNFGDTAGDGGGNAAFGFVISGLDPGVEYTFWLYQYNSSASLFSEPTEVSVVTGGGSTGPVDSEPTEAAPTPTEDGTNVISMYSDAYTDVSVDTWLTPWSSGQLEDLQIDGNPTKRYYNLNFIGIETVANPIDASEMDYIHLDVWSPNATVFRVKLVDLGSSVEGELAFNIPQNQWESLEIPLEDFADPSMVTNAANLLTVRNSLQQLILSGTPAGTLEVFVDNIYFGKESEVGSETFTFNNGTWTPEIPFGVSTIADEIVVTNGSVDFNQAISANNLTVNTGATVNVSNTLFVNSSISNNGTIVFKSETNSFGQLAELNGTISGTGLFTVERYIPANRSFRFISAALDSESSIYNNWQESGNSPEGYGTHITGSVSGDNGFDATATGNASLFEFNNANQTWSAISNTNATNLVAGKAYRLYVRGDRNIDLTDNSAQSETSLRASGSLKVGDVLIDNLSETANEFSFISNPYQATVDMSSLTYSNVESGFYWVWDPNVNDDGAYVVVDLSDGSNPSTSLANQYLQPGQAAFVKTLANGSASMTFTEASKNVNEVSNTVFSQNNEPKLNLRLYESQSLQNGEIAYDAIGIRFNANASNAVTHEDAPKMGNPSENLARLENNNFLSIENRQLPETTDELGLAVYNYNHTNYTFEADLSDFDENTSVYLKDNYTDSQTLLENGLNYIEFSVDASIPESLSMNRFSISVENTTLSISDENFENFSVYPNPVTNQQFTIQSGQLSGENANLKLYNISGQVVLTRAVKADQDRLQIQTDGISSGIYIVEFIQGEQIYREKLIIK